MLLVGAKTVPRGLPGPVGVAIDGADAAAEGGWEVGVHFYGGSKGGGGVWDYGGVHSAKVEHGCAVHCYTITFGPLWGDREDVGGAGGDAVAWTSGHRSVRGKGDGNRRGGGGRGWSVIVQEGIKWKTPGLGHQ